MTEETKSGENRIGTRCQICTGCGRCVADAAEQRKMHVVMMNPAAGVSKLSDRTFVYTEQTKGRRLVAVDIGTTTIAMQLYSVDGRVEAEYSCVNPQVYYGADVLSRIQAAQDKESVQEREIAHQAAQRMKEMVTEKVKEGIGVLAEDLHAEETLFMVVAGNTTMIYLLMGFQTKELGHAPFAAGHLEMQETEIAGVKAYIFPGLSAFVGGDIMAGMYACGLKESQKITLLIDLGTNGEMVIGNRDRQIACATAAGPAFEGGVNKGIWGADMIHLLAQLRRRNLLDETGLLADPYFETGIRIGDVQITQESVRAVQLAKGAIGAGIRILLREYGLMSADAGGREVYAFDKVDRVILAGGFGYYLKPEDAVYIGLLPKELADKTASGGNTALGGAWRLGRKMLAEDCWEIKSLEKMLAPKETKVINLAEHAEFETLYLENMQLI
ncbi:MAG: DUF4445 domain-containing protein [Lachnospiraceae bacterium]|nr:DUF4445 domain-containing protein [Lachnospiraceae bacterium]